MRVVVIVLLLATVHARAQQPGEEYQRDMLIIEATHVCYRFEIYLAIDRAQQIQGLMHVRELPAMSGMLFVYDRDEIRSMWMKNTYIPLDIAFVRRDGSIANIVVDTEPLSLSPIASTEPVTYVLELNAGTAARLAIAPGDRLHWEPDIEQQQ